MNTVPFLTPSKESTFQNTSKDSLLLIIATVVDPKGTNLEGHKSFSKPSWWVEFVSIAKWTNLNRRLFSVKVLCPLFFYMFFKSGPI